MRIESASYNSAILPEHQGNPLIEALAPKTSDEALAQRLSHYPNCSENERQLSAFERLEYLTRLKDLRQPLPLYLRCFQAIEMAIKEGYSSKNPLSPTTQNYLHYSVDARPPIEPQSGFFKPKGSGITIIGESGVGKTCMVEQILGCFPDVIEHNQYNGTMLNFQQVVWLKVDCPDDSSVRALCHKILAELDRKLFSTATKPESTIAALLGQIEARIKSSFLGILVIDEMQNLNLAKSGGAERLMGFLHNLVNNLGIPILFCANPPFNNLLSKTLKTARRAESSGYFDVSLMENDEVWELFIDSLWELQWTNSATPLTKELSSELYNLSVGNMDLAVRIFREAQRCIIGSGNERISIEVLKYAATNTVRASAEAVETIRSQKSDYDTLANARKLAKPSRTEPIQSEKSNSKEAVVSHETLHTIPGDLTRVQHPEFANKLRLIQQLQGLEELIKDPNSIQRIVENDSLKMGLEEAGLLYQDPLLKYR